MADIEQQIREIKTRISQAQTAKARAGIELDNATAAIKKAKLKLWSEFAIETAVDAKDMLATLEEELVRDIQAATDILEGMSV